MPRHKLLQVPARPRPLPSRPLPTAPALSPFVAATHYASSTVPMCYGKNGTAVAADTDVVALFSGEVCFAPPAARPTPPTPPAPEAPAAP